jgi:hypothetical protein
MRRGRGWWRGIDGRMRRCWRDGRLAAAALVDRAAVALRICPWGWHRRVAADGLVRRVRAAYRRGSFRALWTVEALGFRHAATAPGFATGAAPPRVPAHRLPEESLLMLHVGLGLALAKRDLADCRRASHAPAAVGRFLADAEAGALPEFVDAVAEPLGVVARFEHPRCVSAIGRALADLAPELAPWFWHGVGRCLLFLPQSFVPSPDAAWRAARRLAREIEVPEHRDRARVGWACGVTLLHMRRPWLLADLLRRHGGEVEGAGDGLADDFREGVVEAIDVRRESTPGCEEMIEAFLAHRPSHPRVAERWRRLVEQPGLEALAALPLAGETALSRRRAAARRLVARPPRVEVALQLPLDLGRAPAPIRRPPIRRSLGAPLVVSRA